MLLKLSGFFALWEVAKIFIGRNTIEAECKKPEVSPLACSVALFEIPYMLWGIWLLFADVRPALGLWELTMFAIIMRYKFNVRWPWLHWFDGAASAAILALIFMGRI